MDKRLLRYYEGELRFVRETAGEFAREFPKIAGRLGLNEFECADPYVERLLEGFAFLSARVQFKLDAEFPRLTQSLLQTLLPNYLAPRPSMAVVQFGPDLADPALAAGLPVPRGTALRSQVGRGEQTACEFRTAHAIRLYPLKVGVAGYHTRDISSLRLPDGALSLPGGGSVKAALRIKLETTAGVPFSALDLDELDLYIRGSEATPSRIFEALFADCRGIVALPGERPTGWFHRMEPDALRPVGMAPDEAALPWDLRSYDGYRLLEEYFALPQRYLFAGVRGLAAAAKRCTGSSLDLVFLLGRANPDLEGNVDAQTFPLFCTPAANVFPRRLDRVALDDRSFEHLVVADRTRPLDFEVFRVTEVLGFAAGPDPVQRFEPFYASTDRARGGGEALRIAGGGAGVGGGVGAGGGVGGAYYTLNRQRRVPSQRERTAGKRSSYAGSEVFISIVDAECAPYSPDLKQLGIHALCTNRDLPLSMPVGVGRTDFTTDVGAAVENVRCVAGPTPPRPSRAEGELAWRLVNHLSLNYLSLVDSQGEREEESGAAALRELLSLYADASDPAQAAQVAGLRSVQTRPVTRRVDAPGAIAFARGLEVGLTMEEAKFEGSGAFVLACVLERFLSRFVSVNSFTETVYRSGERGEIKRWPARIGSRAML